MTRASATHTIVSSARREVVIGFDRPFTVIGERINPTGRKLLAEEMKAGDFSRVERDAVAQVEAGAHMLDVNAGIPLADEPAILARTIRLVQALVDVPLSIDSSRNMNSRRTLTYFHALSEDRVRAPHTRWPWPGKKRSALIPLGFSRSWWRRVMSWTTFFTVRSE